MTTYQRAIFFLFTMLASTLALANADSSPALDPVTAYYGKSLDGATPANIKYRLLKVVRSAHVHRDQMPDLIVPTCAQAVLRPGDTCQDVTILGYERARKKMFGEMFLKQATNGSFSVRDVYCQKDWAATEFPSGKGPGPDKIPDGNLVNCEHTWPQSRFNGNEHPEAQVSDLHHLFPTDNKMNGTRANYQFGMVDKKSASELKCAGNFIGPVLVPSGMESPADKTVYEVPDAQKGNTARALFYFSVRYHTTMSEIEERYMREWNKLDPVDDAERTVNDQIQQFQGNRNPFVDFPELVDMVPRFASPFYKMETYKNIKARKGGGGGSGEQKPKTGKKPKSDGNSGGSSSGGSGSGKPGGSSTKTQPDPLTLAPHKYANKTLELVDSSGSVVKTLTGIKEACSNLNYGVSNAAFASYELFALADDGTWYKIKGDDSKSFKTEKHEPTETLAQIAAANGLPCTPISK